MDLTQMCGYEHSPMNNVADHERVTLDISPTGDSNEASQYRGHDEREAGIREHNEQRVARSFSNVGNSVENQHSSRGTSGGMPPISPVGPRLSNS